MRPVFLIVCMLAFWPVAQAAPVLLPATLSSAPVEGGGIELSWQLPEGATADEIFIHAAGEEGNTTIALPGDTKSYIVAAEDLVYTMTYSDENGTSLPSNPILTYPYPCTEYIGWGVGVPPVWFPKECWCPMPVVGPTVCDNANEIFP